MRNSHKHKQSMELTQLGYNFLLSNLKAKISIPSDFFIKNYQQYRLEIKNMSLISKIKSLNFPPDQYVVIGSGILDALGIRPSVDIDIAVLPELHKRLKESGEWKEKIKYDKIFLEKDIIEIGPDLPWEYYSTTTKEAIASAQIIEGIPFMNLNELIKFKQALGREKDLKDIETIKKYLNK
jgi:hypothetical protein